MSRLDELIAELCPDGVEYKKLGEVATYANIRIPVSMVNCNTYVGVENLLPNKQGKTISNSVPKEGVVIQFNTGDILIGNIRPYLRKIWLADCDGGTNGDVLAIQIRRKTEIIPSYLYYVLSSEDFFVYDVQYSKGAKMPRGSKDAIMNYRLPVPPLPVQQEIVRILDHFTELTAELTRELTARKKQYKYYREQLLSYDDSVKKVKVGDVCDVFTGGEPPQDCIKGNNSDAEHPYAIWGNGKDIYGYSGTYRIDKDAVVISSIGANTGSVYFRKAFFTPIIRLKVIVPKDDSLDMRFLYHAMSATKIESKSSSVPNMNATEIKAILFPLPNIEEQRRVAQILDRFDVLCEDLSSGIPAEIEARTRQYEYYRDKLLLFKELK